jgi:hypothetical protein
MEKNYRRLIKEYKINTETKKCIALVIIVFK